MKYYQKIDLSKLPKPTIIDEIDIDQAVRDMEKDHVKYVKKIPGIGDDYELAPYDPVRIFYKVSASYNSMIVNKINGAFQARMLAYASGDDLTNFVAENGTVRDGEDDNELRQKYLNTFSSLNTAGSFEGYVHHTLENIEGEHGSKSIADCYPYSLIDSSLVKLVILPKKVLMVAAENESEKDKEKREMVAAENESEKDKEKREMVAAENESEKDKEKRENEQELIRKRVEDYFKTNKYVRPLTNKVEVSLARVRHEDLVIELDVKEGVSKKMVLSNAEKRLKSYVNSSYKIGFDIYKSALIHYAMNENIENCKVVSPSEDIECSRDEVFICKNLVVREMEA